MIKIIKTQRTFQYNIKNREECNCKHIYKKPSDKVKWLLSEVCSCRLTDDGRVVQHYTCSYRSGVWAVCTCWIRPGEFLFPLQVRAQTELRMIRGLSRWSERHRNIRRSFSRVSHSSTVCREVWKMLHLQESERLQTHQTTSCQCWRM